MSLSKPDIVKVMRQEGVDLKEHGRILTACCVLHDEKSPSLTVWPEKQRFHCFGCGAGGDCIDFIQQLHGLSFKEARDRLLIAKESPVNIRTQETKKDLLKRFKEWEFLYFTKLCKEYRMILSEMEKVRDEWELDVRWKIYHRLPVVEWKLSVLIEGREQDKLELYRRMR